MKYDILQKNKLVSESLKTEKLICSQCENIMD